MPPDDTSGTDLPASGNQPDYQKTIAALERKLSGNQGTIKALEAQVAQLSATLDAERDTWQQQTAEAAAAAEATIADLTSKWVESVEQSQTLSQQLEATQAAVARQDVMLEFPTVITGPLVELVKASQLAPEQLRETLAALGSSQAELVEQGYRQAQRGSTPPLQGANSGTTADVAGEAWEAAKTALAAGDLPLYQQHRNTFLANAGKDGELSKPAFLAGPLLTG